MARLSQLPVAEHPGWIYWFFITMTVMCVFHDELHAMWRAL
jgi:hypothetical protein